MKLNESRLMVLYRTCLRGRRGFTLIELSIVFGIVGVVMAAIWTAAGNVRTAQKNNDAVQELQSVVQNILAVMAGRQFPAGPIQPLYFNSPSLIVGAFASPPIASQGPDPWPAGQFATPWGTAFRVYTLNPTTFRVSFYDLPNIGSCVNLLFQGTNCSLGSACPIAAYTFWSLPVSTMPEPVTGWSDYPNGGMSTAAAHALCTQNVVGHNSVEFDYSL